ncbi:hypothetical protein TGMAS_417230 [Toxoplasma gondii MAS]|uniref:Uncharacterized protein n=1 Tax=Toxoplasma gondii MAS TaxID=943118 RepID=A0A086PJQ8_TOXGO|nr:hypothetical protein TGMAS_417230 [Toxoplasma gondii MAS]
MRKLNHHGSRVVALIVGDRDCNLCPCEASPFPQNPERSSSPESLAQSMAMYWNTIDKKKREILVVEQSIREAKFQEATLRARLLECRRGCSQAPEESSTKDAAGTSTSAGQIQAVCLSQDRQKPQKHPEVTMIQGFQETGEATRHWAAAGWSYGTQRCQRSPVVALPGLL